MSLQYMSCFIIFDNFYLVCIFEEGQSSLRLSISMEKTLKNSRWLSDLPKIWYLIAIKLILLRNRKQQGNLLIINCIKIMNNQNPNETQPQIGINPLTNPQNPGNNHGNNTTNIYNMNQHPYYHHYHYPNPYHYPYPYPYHYHYPYPYPCPYPYPYAFPYAFPFPYPYPEILSFSSYLPSVQTTYTQPQPQDNINFVQNIPQQHQNDYNNQRSVQNNQEVIVPAANLNINQLQHRPIQHSSRGIAQQSNISRIKRSQRSQKSQKSQRSRKSKIRNYQWRDVIIQSRQRPDQFTSVLNLVNTLIQKQPIEKIEQIERTEQMERQHQDIQVNVVNTFFSNFIRNYSLHYSDFSQIYQHYLKAECRWFGYLLKRQQKRITAFCLLINNLKTENQWEVTDLQLFIKKAKKFKNLRYLSKSITCHYLYTRHFVCYLYLMIKYFFQVQFKKRFLITNDNAKMKSLISVQKRCLNRIRQIVSKKFAKKRSA